MAVPREVLQTLVSIWPHIARELETDLAKIKERLVRAPGVDEIRTLQGRGLAIISMLNMPTDLAQAIIDADEEARKLDLKRMNQSD